MATLNYQQLKREFVEKSKRIDREERRERRKEVTLSTLKRIQSKNLPWKYDIFKKKAEL
mgnify:FL=1